jgi:hypothetical protein
MGYLYINNFKGLVTNVDPRYLQPNKDNAGIADATVMENMEATREGSLITSSGYELFSEGVGADGIRNLYNYDKDDDERYLLISAGDHHYSIDPTNVAWNDLGDYGDAASEIGGTTYFGNTAERVAIVGTSGGVNTPQQVDITNPMNPIGGTAPKGYIMVPFMGRLFIAVGNILHYSDIEDEDSWIGTIKFNDIITGLSVNGERITVITRTFNQGVVFTYDDSFNLSTPLKEPYERPYGCLAPLSVQKVGSDSYYWSERGVMRLGSEQGIDEVGLPRPLSLSKDIEPSLRFTNKKYRNVARSAHFEKNQQYWLSVPYGTDQFPSRTFVYDETWKIWTLRTGFYPGGLTTARDEDYEEQLYFGDHFSQKIYKFNDESYSYDGDGYTRKWVSKVFTFGTSIQYKRFKRIDIIGSMDSATRFYITVDVDGTKKKYEIDNTFLIRNSYSNYIGDNWKGDAWLGGDAPSETRFKRFYAPLDFDRDIREGAEIQITLENSNAEEPFKIDFIGIDYEILPTLIKRDRVNTQKTT